MALRKPSLTATDKVRQQTGQECLNLLAGILGHLAVSISRLTSCHFCSVMVVDGLG
jgi:hypothetical protein